MKNFMVVCWLYNGGDDVIARLVWFYDSLAEARKIIETANEAGDKAQLYMWHGDGPDGYYVYYRRPECIRKVELSSVYGSVEHGQNDV